MKEAEASLLKAIAGESMARNKYTYYSEIAAKEGLIWISRVFLETADNEKAHAQEELEELKELTKMTNSYDIHPLGKTLENLRNAAAGEKYETTIMYPDFAKVAESENNSSAARLFSNIKEVEARHEVRFTKLADLLEAGKLYETETEIEWECLNCGFVHRGTKAPDTCPLCKKPQGWYEGKGVV